MKPPESLAQTEKSTEGKLPVSSPESVRRYVVTLLRRNRGLFLALVALNSVAAAASIRGPQVHGGQVENNGEGVDNADVNKVAKI
ncbi:MAG: ABC transporter ATP-binding protein, partial [Actinomycetia bacterium]|nr:ABC transporter ATP-binding protein [Actinomycetes bacterium]